ncbi:hypothetical protein RF11_05517 [Thelohanellus kitauei]|uniref:Uncharacterized protein n=1 Tax=Thelohanellus kitauei TaxID=669202 RepID=A0A0C2MSQ6_THEKT|nr:hypothetical protein RF11_05517 [Thelohanellus kitauei]
MISCISLYYIFVFIRKTYSKIQTRTDLDSSYYNPFDRYSNDGYGWSQQDQTLFTTNINIYQFFEDNQNECISREYERMTSDQDASRNGYYENVELVSMSILMHEMTHFHLVCCVSARRKKLFDKSSDNYDVYESMRSKEYEILSKDL